MYTIKNKILKNLGISYLKRLFRVTNGPTYASLFITRRCNFNCSYCTTSTGSDIPDISIRRWKNIVSQLYNQGCRYITIYGGEPTLREDLGVLIKHCIDLEIFTHVVTNGALLNRKLLEEFASYGYFLLGISIDCFKSTNSSPKKYDSRLIKLLQDIKNNHPDQIDYSIHIIITKKNIEELIPLIRTIRSKLDCRFSLDPVHSSNHPEEQYKYRGFCPELVLTREIMTKLMKTIQGLKRHGIQLMSPNLYYYFMNKWYYNKYTWRCDAGDLYYAINNDGKVMLCEDVKTPLTFDDYLKLSHKKRVKKIKQYKFDYCDCFKPCYWNPTNFIKHPITNYLYKYKFR